MTPSLLGAFRHPLVILSIFVLLFNDHVLKTAAPSWLTGKLSDFAGLFFFPFLLGVMLQFGLRHRVDARKILLVSALITGLSFAAIKTLPTANRFAENAVSAFLGLPARFVLDPTDLLALLVLPMMWLMWKSIQPAQPAPAPGRLAYAALGLGALASLATAPCPTVPSIRYLAVSAEMIYANAPDYTGQAAQGAYTSRDRGKTWEYTEQVPEDVRQEFSQLEKQPMTLCDPANSQICYRIDGRAMVEESQDGGQTWRTAWEIPLGRQDFLRRVAAGGGILLRCGKTFELATFDMAFIPESSPSTLIVAMGNEGVLIHSSDKAWQRTAFEVYSNGIKQPYNPAPTPLAARTFGEALRVMQLELLISLVVGFLFYTAASIVIWVKAARYPWPGIKDGPAAKNDPEYVLRPMRILAIWILILAAAWLCSLPRFFPGEVQTVIRLLPLVASLLTPLVLLVLSVIIWRRVNILSGHAQFFTRVAWFLFLAGSGVVVVALVGFLLWAFGVIEMYTIAMLLVMFVGTEIIASTGAWIIRRMHRLMAADAGPKSTV